MDVERRTPRAEEAKMDRIVGIVTTLGDKHKPTNYATTMAHPAARAYAVEVYRGRNPYSQIMAGLAAAAVVGMAIVGVLASCHN